MGQSPESAPALPGQPGSADKGEGDGPGHGPNNRNTALARAWALKDLCYQAWSTDPARAVRTAQDLQALLTDALPAAQRGEISALADWTGGLAAVIQGRMADAVLAFDRAAAGLRAAGQADAAAQTQVPKIMALSMLGQHRLATDCAVAAQRELRALGNLGAAARVSQNLGALLYRRDAYADAARHYREAALLFARLQDHLHSVLADIGLADAMTALGDFDEAQRIYARARMRATRHGLALPLAMVDESLALLDLARGRYREALAGLVSARDRYQALGLPQYLAIAEKQLGDAYLELRLLPEARALLATAEQRFRQLGLPDEEAWVLAQGARTDALLGQVALAGAGFAAAARLFAAQGNAVGQAAVALAQAELALADGQSATALQHARRAQQGFDAAGQADGSARAAVLSAQARLQGGEVAQAQAAFEAALASAQALQQWPVQQRCLVGLGQAALARADAAGASRYFESAIAAFEERRLALPGDEIRSAFLTDHLRPYQAQLHAALASADAVSVLWQADRIRARALDERLQAGPAQAPDDDTQALRERLNWLYRRVQRLQDDGEDSPSLVAELRQTERALLERARRQRLQPPAVLANPPPANPPPANQALAGRVGPDAKASSAASPSDAQALRLALQAALAEGDALVAYGIDADDLFAVVVTPGAIQLLRHLAPWSAALAALRAAQFQLETLRNGLAPVAQHLPMLARRAQARLQALHEVVWAPLAPALAACRRVLVVPHGPLGGLPLAALHDGRQCLGERFDLALAPSVRAALRGLQSPAKPARRVLALGESSRLPHAAQEALAVAALYPAGQAWVGADATLARLTATAAQADVLHLACHAQFRSDNPRFSALYLLDAVLSVEAIEALQLPACTVVLSACETAQADSGLGDEQVGLVRAFLGAGAARVLASLWPVDDAITAAFMVDFHQALAAGSSPAAALRQAQQASCAAHPHPYFWAAFTLYGGW